MGMEDMHTQSTQNNNSRSCAKQQRQRQIHFFEALSIAGLQKKITKEK
jgi:hypothetical protein